MIVTYIHSNRPADRIRTQLRVRNLADAINRTGFHRANVLNLDSFIENSPDAERICARSDLLIIYRYLYGPILTTIRYWKARGKRVIVDFDQAIDFLTPDMPDYPFWLEGMPLMTRARKDISASRISPIPLEQFKWGLEMLDAATVSSARLENDWTRYVNVYELPDFLNTCQYPIPNQARDGEVWIGLGPTVPYASFKNSGLATAMEHVCREYPQARLVLSNQGNKATLDLDICREQIVAYTPGSFEEWVNLLLNLDVGLAPVYGDFDLRLSPVHLLEFMIAKVPWIATKQVDLHNLIRYGRWVQNSVDAWERGLSQIMEQLDLYQKKARGEPFLYALGKDIGANIDKTLRIYSAIVNQ